VEPLSGQNKKKTIAITKQDSLNFIKLNEYDVEYFLLKTAVNSLKTLFEITGVSDVTNYLVNNHVNV